MKNLDHPIRQYHELIITDTTYSVFSELSLNYTADYELTRNNLMKHYIKDIHSLNSGYLDTLQFYVSVRKDSLVLTNFLNPENGSSWVRIENSKVFDVINSPDDYYSYALDFRNRYSQAILNERPDSLKQRALDYFDRDWNIKRQTDQ